MKIILVRPYYNSHIITPPIGLGYLSSYLKDAGIEVLIIDGLRDKMNNKNLLKIILSEKPDAVAITCMTAYYHQVINLSKLLKSHGIKCVIGGVHPTFLPYKTLIESNCDYVICGEGEIPLLSLAKNNFDNENIKGIYSLNYLKNSEQTFGRADIIENLDDIPIPDWQQIAPRSYPRAPHGAFTKNYPIGIITTTRGCIYKCTFCAGASFYNHKIRYRSPENVVQEILFLQKNYGIKEIHFEDDNLTFKRDHIVNICELILKSGIKISWGCPNGIRADKVDGELLELMAKSGCYFIAFGIESANQRILKDTNKNETIEVITNAIKLAEDKGIATQGFFIFGLPGETKGTLEESIQFSLKSGLSRAQFLILDILPGSELWDSLEGSFTPNWDKNSYKEPEWIPNNLRRKDLIKAQSKAFRKFYFRPGILFKTLKFIHILQLKYLLNRISDYRLFRKVR